MNRKDYYSIGYWEAKDGKPIEQRLVDSTVGEQYCAGYTAGAKRKAEEDRELAEIQANRNNRVNSALRLLLGAMTNNTNMHPILLDLYMQGYAEGYEKGGDGAY